MQELSAFQNGFLVAARIMFVAVFAFQDAIYNKIIYAKRSIAYMQRHALPCPLLWLVLTIMLELFAGFTIILGWHASWGAFLLLCFTLIVTVIFHRFWKHQEPQERQNQLNHFMKNICIMGGAIFIVVFGVGTYHI